MDMGSLGGVVGGVGAYAAQRKSGPLVKAETESERSSRLAGVRERMRSGYYQSDKVSEAVSDKLSGAFDKLA